MRHFYIDPTAVTKPLVALKGSDAHHIKNVLRLKPDDRIKLIDGTGHEYEAVIKMLDTEKVEIEIRHEFQSPVASGVRILVAQAFLKEKKMDDLVRKLSELGIAGWIPFFSSRSIARPDKDRLVGRTHRWKRIAAEAVKQCRRRDILQISDPFSFEEVLELGNTCDLKIVFWENETAPLNRETGLKGEKFSKKILLMLGPEGGFAEQEIEMARKSGFWVSGLGPRILRAETATLAACALVQYLYGDMGPGVDRAD